MLPQIGGGLGLVAAPAWQTLQDTPRLWEWAAACTQTRGPLDPRVEAFCAPCGTSEQLTELLESFTQAAAVRIAQIGTLERIPVADLVFRHGVAVTSGHGRVGDHFLEQKYLGVLLPASPGPIHYGVHCPPGVA